jgi:hypothetical protein
MTGKRGGKRPGAGRPAGSPNRATKALKATLSDLAKEYAPEALRTLALIMREGESEMARIAAADKLLDRGYGKPSQAVAVTGADGGAVQVEDVSDQKRLAAVALMAARAARGEK